MDFFNGSGSHEFVSFRLGKEMSGQRLHDSNVKLDINPRQTPQASEAEIPERPRDLRAIIELSSTSDTESCGAYFTRKIESLGTEDPITLDDDDELTEQGKASVSDPVHVTPGLNFPEDPVETTGYVPKVTYLETFTPPNEAHDPKVPQTQTGIPCGFILATSFPETSGEQQL